MSRGLIPNLQLSRFWSAALLFLTLSAAAAAQETLTIGVPKTLSSLPFYELEGAAMEGKVLKMVTFDDHALAYAQFLSGQLDLILTGFSQGAANSRTNPDLRHLMTPVWGVSSLVTLDPTLKNLSDLSPLAGKILLVPFAGSPLDLQLRAILRSQGLESRVIIQYAPLQQQIPLLLNAQAHGISVPEPLATRLLQQNGAHRVFSFAQAWSQLTGGDPRSPQVSLFGLHTRRARWEKSLPALSKALQKSVTLIRADPEILAKKYAAFFGISEAWIAQGLKNTLLELPPAPDEKAAILTYQRLIGDDKPLGRDFFEEQEK